MTQEKVGLIIGKFLPLHKGHLFFINRAATMVDKLIVLVDENKETDGKKCKDAGIKYPNLVIRETWLTSIFKDVPHIEVVGMNEDGLENYPNGWKLWSDRVKETVKSFGVNTIFTSDAEYSEGYDTHFPNWEKVFFDNNRVATNGMSATLVRSDMNKNWGNMSSQVRQFFTKKICFVGGESVGKSTLVRAMAKSFNTSWADEYGKTYIDDGVGKYFDVNGTMLMSEKDYDNILIGQTLSNNKAFLASNIMTLIDSDAVYTKFFFKDQFNKEYPMGDAFINSEKQDYIYIYLEDNVPFVEIPGYRTNKTRDKIKDFYIDNGIVFDYVISANNYTDRFDKVHTILKALTDEKNI